LVRQTVVYGLSGVLLQVVGVVTLPIFTHTFDSTQYGVIGLALVTSTLAYILVDLGLGSAAQRSYFDRSEDQQSERRAVLLTATVTETAIATAVAAILIVLRDPLSALLFGTPRFHLLVVLIGVNLPLTALMLLTREAMRLTFRPWRYFASALIAGLGATATSLVAVYALHAGVAGLLWGLLAGTAASAVFGLFACRGAIGGRWSGPELRVMFRFGLPLVPAAFAQWGLTFADRFMLRALSTTSEVGLYTVANQIAGVLLFVVSAFSLAFSPYILSLYADDPELEKRARAQTLVYLTVVLATVAVVLGVFARELVAVLAPRQEYAAAYETIALLAAGGVAFGINAVTLAGISYRRATHWFAIYTTVAAVVNFSLNFALIPPFGQVGAGVAQASALILLGVLYYRRAQSLYPTPFDAAKVLKTCALAAAAAAVGFAPIHDLVLALGLHAITVLVFLALLRPLGVIEAHEIAHVRELLRRPVAWPGRGVQ
jgi:O-antigen/teichoic acid export membrane protein